MLPEAIYIFSQGLKDVAEPFPNAEELPEPWKAGMKTFTSLRSFEYSGMGFQVVCGLESDLLYICGSCTSTMDVAAGLVQQKMLPEWGSVLAYSQNGGRGQLRRPWQSPAGNLYATIRWPSTMPKAWREAETGLFSIVVGWCFLSAAESLGATLELKWPNDLLQNGRKVGGLLVEDRFGTTLVGLGLNLVHHPDDDQMRSDAACPAGDLKIPLERRVLPNLWSNLENQAKSIYERLTCDFTPQEFLTLAESRLAWLGRTVLVRDGGEPAMEGRLTGLSHDGGLIVVRNGVESVVRSGSVLPV